MATEFQRMFGCPVCGYRINETESACPRCNNQFDIGTKFECPFCGELVDPKVKECPVCHVDYAEFKRKTKKKGRDADIDTLLNEIIKMESMEVKEEPKKFSCPDCSWLLDGSEGKCPKCGKDLSDEIALQCPICGAPVPPDAISCQECGAKFEEAKAESSPPIDKPQIDELEVFATEVKGSSPVIEPKPELETKPIEQPVVPVPDAPPVTEPPAVEPSVPEMQPPAVQRTEIQAPENVTEAPPEQPLEPAAAKPATPKAKKRKLKAKTSTKSGG